MIDGHGGNVFALAADLGCRPDQILDFSSNINPLGCMPELAHALRDNIDTVVCLPEVDNRGIVKAFGDRHRIPADELLAGNGTTQFIYALPKALAVRRALILAPTYADYADACRYHGVAWTWHFSEASDDFQVDLTRLSAAIGGHDAVYLCNPNNPTGGLIPGRSLGELCAAHPATRFIVDESYLPFVPDAADQSLLRGGRPNVVVLHSLSKIFGIPGLRIGFMRARADLIKAVASHLPPWSVNILAQKAADYLLSHAEPCEAFVRQTRVHLQSQRQHMIARLQALPGLRCYPSLTSFFLSRLPRGLAARDLHRHLSGLGILIRDCANFNGLDERYFRIALKTEPANHKLIDALTRWFDRRRPVPEETH